MSKFPRKESPYRLKSHSEVFERDNKSFVVDHLDLRGNDIEYSYLKKKGGVCIVALNNQNEAVMVGQWRYPLNKYSWEFPAGGQESGEEIYDTAVRELKEEAGIVADEWTHLGSMNPNASNCTMESHAYLAKGLHIGEATPEEDETLELMWLPWEDVVQGALDGEITEALSIFAIFKAQAYLQSLE